AQVKFRCDPDDLSEALQTVQRGVSNRPGIPALTGAHIEAEDGGTIVLTTTDLEVSARLVLPVQVGEPGVALVPARLLADMVKSLPPAPVEFDADAGRAASGIDKGEIEIFLDQSQVAVRAGGLTMTSRLIEGQFPNYRQLLPEGHESQLVVGRQALLDAVRRVGLLARENTPVRLEFNALGVRLTSQSPDLGNAVEAVEAKYEGEDLTVAVNPGYLADGLEAALGDYIRLEVRDGVKPGVVRSERQEFENQVVPVRPPAAV